MATVTIQEAQSTLPDLIHRLAPGEHRMRHPVDARSLIWALDDPRNRSVCIDGRLGKQAGQPVVRHCRRKSET